MSKAVSLITWTQKRGAGQSHLLPDCGLFAGGTPYPRHSYHSEYAADGRCAERRSRLQLSSCLLTLALVDMTAGALSGALARRALRTRRNDLPGRRRNRGRPSRQESLRQRPASRRRAFVAFVHSVPLRPQVGRAGSADPFPVRPSALPVLVVLYRGKDSSKRRHKTPSQLMRQMLKVLLHWFPERSFVFAGDGGYGTHELSRTAARRRRPQRLTLVSRFYRDANLYTLPAARARRGAGRPPKKGKKLPSPERVVARTQQRQRLKVAWYGGGQRNVEIVQELSSVSVQRHVEAVSQCAGSRSLWRNPRTRPLSHHANDE